MTTYEDVILELARIEREAYKAAEEKIRSQQLGLAWIDLVDESEQIEGCEKLAA